MPTNNQPKPKLGNVRLNFYSDAGHGWLRAPLSLLGDLGVEDDISRYSYWNGGWVYLEEDRDAGILQKALEARGQKLSIKEMPSAERSNIRSYPSYNPIPARKPKP